jgi:serine/threonine protein phosphatase PrpC
MTDSRLTWGARTDTGRLRENNEDSFRIDPELGLFVLSDGMGGQASGEVASRFASEAVVAHCRAANSNGFSHHSTEPVAGASESSNILTNAIRRANNEIHEAAAKNPAWRGMGATIVAARLNGQLLTLAHVGDSRAYRLRSSHLEQLTEDHSFVAEQVRRGILTPLEAERSNFQSVLLRALGPDPNVEVGIREEAMRNGDTILLCSDGLTRELSDAQISAVLANAKDAQSAADQLVDLANQAGGEDNITVIVLRRNRRQSLGSIARWFKRSNTKP